MAAEMVIPIEDMADPLPIRFAFKCTNIDGITIYVKAEIDTPPAGWNGAAQQLGSLAVGIDNYFLCDSYTRDKPANLTEETIDLKITYYSDAGYSVPINSETIAFTITYVDFDDVGFTVVDDDGFEVDTEGWTGVNEAGTVPVVRSTIVKRTGVGSLGMNFSSSEVGYAHKSFAIGAVTRAFIRVWHWHDGETGDEWIFEIWTDAGGGSERILRLTMDAAPIGGTEVMKQWICSGLKVPVNGTYQVRLRVRAEYASADYIFFDDIRVVQS